MHKVTNAHFASTSLMLERFQNYRVGSLNKNRKRAEKLILYKAGSALNSKTPTRYSPKLCILHRKSLKSVENCFILDPSLNVQVDLLANDRRPGVDINHVFPVLWRLKRYIPALSDFWSFINTLPLCALPKQAFLYAYLD